MTKRLPNNTKWLWCVLVLYSTPGWYPVNGGSVKSPPKNPTTVEAQAKFFQDFFSVQLSPYKIEFGHVCEDPNTWEQRYESNDLKNHRAMGKVRWGDKKGGYGEHYWDLNHAGHADEHPDDSYNHDDGSYDPKYENDAYDEPSDVKPTYENDEPSSYDSEKASYSPYDENGRSKRHHRVKTQKKGEDETVAEALKTKKHKTPKQKEEPEKNTYDNTEEDGTEEDEVTEAPEPKPIRKHKKASKPREKVPDEIVPADTNSHLTENEETPPQQYYYPATRQLQAQHHNQFVPYEQGSGVRNYQAPVVGPRLFLEPSTGHVVDRTTGQAYVLQPVALSNYN